ncbi:hypothetical protein BGZ46_009588 [Entomortierella lignicola]|nr:hypothetical protein BGZ46_009588 [Entomortierella lignicola]
MSSSIINIMNINNPTLVQNILDLLKQEYLDLHENGQDRGRQTIVRSIENLVASFNSVPAISPVSALATNVQVNEYIDAMATKTADIIQRMFMRRFQNLTPPLPSTMTPNDIKLWTFLDHMRNGQARQANRILVSNWSPDDHNLLLSAGLEIYMRTVGDEAEGLLSVTDNSPFWHQK